MMGSAPAWLTEVPYAHRGLHDPEGTRPENSLAAFEAAVEAGVGIELDVHLTADGHAVVTHDDDLERVTGRRLSVAGSPLVHIAALRLGATDERIPTLPRVLDLVAGRVPVMVEIKNVRREVGALEPAVAAALDGRPGPVCVASFNPRTVGWFARYRPEVVRGQTSSSYADVPAPYLARRFLASMTANRWTRPHFVSYELSALPNAWCDRWRDRGGALVTWTVRSPQDVVKARAVADTAIFEHVHVPW
ncbi:MAG: glycerophosphodiester phosphodiesterase [Actinobacteria bacterium]|nr:glycerophosphodiester phosphodiesterase [Actinomycetota bacterium]